MSVSRKIFLYLLQLILFLISSSFVLAQNRISYEVISSGGSGQSNASNYLVGTIGETVIGKTNNNLYNEQIGFWYLYKLETPSNVFNQETIPEIFNLGQNFPNPFNPTTIITYSVPQRSNVSIKIYDALGKEISTLVSEEQEIGVYEINFEALNFASGIYIYQMVAGSYISTKKMMLIK